MAAITAILKLCSATHCAAQEQSPAAPAPFHFGFSTGLLREFNENDAKASMRTWVHAVVSERHLPADPEAKLLTGIPEISAAIQQQKVDGIVLPTDEFWALKQPQAFNHYMFGAKEGSITEEYVLLVHKASNLAQVGDLRGLSLNILQHSKMCLAPYWLDAMLMQKGLKPSSQHFARANESAKLTKTVLPVFFRQVDACLVTRSGFKTMVELNPQIGEELQILASSEPVVPTLVCFREGYSPEIQDKIITEFTALHNSPSGQQVLTVFQVDRLQEQSFSCLSNSLALLETYSQLRATPHLAETSKLSNNF